MKNKRTIRNRQRGFSLIELLVAIGILMVIMGVVFQQIEMVQKRNRSEEVKLDIFQTAREFIDQMTRDIHQAGFPNGKMYASAYQNPGLRTNAVGIFFISPTEVHFQGDVDADGIVDYVAYKLVPQSTNPGDANCPCLRRSQLQKADDPSTPYDPFGQAPDFRTQVENITFKVSGSPTSITGERIFRAFDKYGNEITLPATGLTRTNWDPADDGWQTTSDPSGITRIWTIQINLDVQAPTTDIGARGAGRPEVFLTATAQVTN
jgi:prepilin-type N-terminal cleavage/methylation domain-containing protein